jgi:protein-tyrosine-phosphatase
MGFKQSRMLTVLFMCRSNADRSIMAEAYLRQRCRAGRVDVASAGLTPAPLHPLAVRVMAEIGVDLAGYTSKSLSLYLGRRSFSIAVAVRGPDELLAPRWSAGEAGGIDAFRACRDDLMARIDAWEPLVLAAALQPPVSV